VASLPRYARVELGDAGIMPVARKARECERSMASLPPAVLAPGATYEDCAVALERAGWELVAAGDWSWVYEDRERQSIARLTPWDPAYERFIRLCRSLSGNRYVPAVFQEIRLAHHGHLAVIERLERAPEAEARTLIAAVQRREEVTGDLDLRALVVEVERISERARESVPFWRGIDANPRNVMRDAAGQLKVVDLFYIGGLDLQRAIRRDIAGVRSQIPARMLWAFTDLPAFNRQVVGREVLRRVLRSVDGTPGRGPAG
jgi:hypothetical protein